MVKKLTFVYVYDETSTNKSQRSCCYCRQVMDFIVKFPFGATAEHIRTVNQLFSTLCYQLVIILFLHNLSSTLAVFNYLIFSLTPL